LYRKQLFDQTLEAIEKENSKPGITYTVGVNRFADLNQYEKARLLGDKGDFEPEDYDTSKFFRASPGMNASPIDWRDRGVIGPVKDQGQCGSCWSFSTVGPTEAHYAIKYGSQLVLAEQQLVDCSGSYGNEGCNGGLFADGYRYVQDFGLEFTADYPYVATDGTCQYDASKVQVRINGTVLINQDPESLKSALQNGPASISLYASSNSFHLYTGGILNDRECPTTVNHAVHTIGWGEENGQEYFIVRNSWGPSWGENGYIRIAVAPDLPLGICGMFYRVPEYPIIV
jgi:cathepsin L